MSSSQSGAGSAASHFTVLNDRYRLLATLAAGGMATVYKGQDTLLNRLVAIKLLRDRYAGDPQFVQRFRQEAQAAANLNHPNIVTIYDVGRDVVSGRERHYIVMELVEGQDLKQALRWRAANGHPFTIEEAVDIARQVCEGVGYAHRRGLVHCDLKPQNVMLTTDGRAKVTDFGIARAYTAMPSTGERADVVWGSPQYYAPEQAAGAAPTPASDVYSIGVMLYEMLAGRLPFESPDPLRLAQMHQTASPPLLHALNPNVTPQLESVVMCALAKDPAQRYRDADQFARALSAYALQGEAQTLVNLPPVTPPPAPSPAAASRPVPQPATGATRASNRAPTSTSNVASPPAAPAQTGPDVLLWLLAALAFLCVLGLIPLYVLVYQAYQTPPAPTATPPSATPALPITSGNLKVKAPALAGKTLEEATRELALLGLGIRVVEERPDGNTAQRVVLEQRPPADALVDPGAVIEVVVSKPVEAREVPSDLIGRTLDAAISQTLAALGWNVVVTEVLDFSPRGAILAVQPPGGSKLAVSETLTLTVSSGGRIALNVDMWPVTLEAVTLQRAAYLPGQAVQFRVTWRANQPVGRDYKVGWYLFNPEKTSVLAQGEDRAPQHNGLPAPTSAWIGGTVVEDTYALRIPDNLSPGAYPLAIGMYDSNGRLRVVNPGNATALDDLVVLYDIIVQ
ncbi:MAG: protein kinase [Anaerolineae bacterium]|nr:protein kinase [Candidatus Roseilinea sp.]MDW8450878.1 protein kinase [Anaerolineae bacterium]